MRTLITNLIVLIFGIVLAVACEEVQPLNDKSVAPDIMLVGPTWQLIALVEADGDLTPIDYDSLPSSTKDNSYIVIFTKQPVNCTPPIAPCGDWYMEATGYPNHGELSYDLLEEQSLAIYIHAITEIAVPENSKESEFFNALRAATSYRINGKQLRIFYDDGNTLLFEPVEPKEE